MIHRECGVLKTTYEADMALFPLPIARWTVTAIAVLMVAVVPLALHEYYLSIVNLISIAVVGALGLNILVGYTGQISIGHGAFMSVGAYTAANFAVVSAQGGVRVCLIDSDLRRPALHKIFGLPNERGLTTALVEGLTAAAVAQETAVPHLSVVTSGALPPNTE